MHESTPETYTAVVPVQQLRRLAHALREAGDIKRAARLDEAADIVCEVLPSSEFDPGDQVQVREAAIAIDAELASYRGVTLTVDQAHGDGDVSCEHPTDGPCSFAAWELESISSAA
jgi:hypothetical protein